MASKILIIVVAMAASLSHAQDLTTKSSLIDSLNLNWQRAETSTHATMDGAKLIIHSERCSKERFSLLSGDASLLRLERAAGFSTLIYTNDKDLTFSLDLPTAGPNDADRLQYAKNYEANLSATHPEVKMKITVEDTRLILHTPFASKQDYYKTDWKDAQKMWVGLGFTEFLYTNDGKVSILAPLRGTPESVEGPSEAAVAPELSKSAEPFGFRKGMTKKEIISAIGADKVEEEGGERLTVTSAPKPNSSFEKYVLLISPENGLLKVAALGKDIATGDSGMELRSAYEELLEGVARKYGKPTKSFDNCSGTGCEDNEFWMLSLKEKNRNLVAFWDLDYAKIMLEAEASRINSGYVVFSVELPGFDVYAKAKKDKQDDSF